MGEKSAMPREVSILGVDYAIRFDKLDAHHDGDVNQCTKEITVKPLGQLDGDNAEEQRFLQDHVMRHEIVHAYLNEAGLMQYSQDETLVDWLAYMIGRMHSTMAEVHAI